MWIPLHLEHRCSELRVDLGRFYLWWIWSGPLCRFWELWVRSRFYLILGWLFQLVSLDRLLEKLFFSLLLWVSICLCPWGGFPVCSKRLGPVYVSSQVVYLLGNWVHWYEEILRRHNYCFLLFLLLELRFCSCGCLLLGVLKHYFLGCSFLPCVEVFPLLSFKGWICGKTLREFGFIMEYFGISFYGNWDFAGYSSLSWHLCSLSVCITSVQDFLAFIVSGEKSGVILICLPSYVHWPFSLSALNILSLFNAFVFLIIMCWEEFLFWSSQTL
jgi:hypothetical protein